TMSVVSWTKLTLNELKDLCTSCGLSTGGNKEELSERLHVFFEKRMGKLPNTSLGRSNDVMRNERDGGIITEERDTDLAGDDLDATSQEADNAFRDVLAAHFQKKEKIEFVLVDIFLSALGSIEKKMDKSFSALHQEIEEGDLLDEKWPKVSLKEFAGVRDDVETRAVMLRLANNRGWSAALQIVGNNDKMMEKYKERIPLVASTLRKESLLRGIKERTKGFIPFVAKKDIALQVVRGQLPASTVEVLATLSQAAHPQVQEPLQSPKMKFDHTRALILEEPIINVNRARALKRGAVSNNWNQRLDKTWELFKNYCKIMSLIPLPSEVDNLASFIVWLDLTHSFAVCADVLTAVSRSHLEA
ncbi:13165_t:CDS:2, partial [Dentiscutata erythropus]